MESLLEACQVIGFDWRYLYVNDACAAQARRPKQELVGRTMMECYPGIDQTPMFAVLRRCMTDRKHDRMENEFTFPDGSNGSFELRFIPVPEGVCILSLDQTESKRTAAALSQTEEQLRQAQKMEAIGRLAGGVAHDFNNLLSVVLSYTSMLLGNLSHGDPMRPDLEEIRKAGKRAGNLTRQLLAFGRQHAVEPHILDLNEVLAGMEKMIRRIVGEDVAVRTHCGSDLAKLKADPGHIEQVLMNLVVNARDAMPHGGSLTIETQNVQLDAEYAAEHLGVTPGSYVMLAVSDTGTGMDKTTREHIFEPFFTTKARGKGTGLGLSTVFGIVQQNGGTVWVYSEPGEGTTFKVYLPKSDGVEGVVAPSVSVATVRGSETVLLVEDDSQVRGVVRSVLAHNGYHVLEAQDGGEALLLCERYDGAIHVVVTDVVMPQMSGVELADRLVSSRGDMKVLYMSGYTDDAMTQHRTLVPGTPLLEKPITPESLLHRLRQVLDAPPSAVAAQQGGAAG
ncbi:MAG: ATP-binding protein [Myxococcota bacterium]